MLDVSVTSFVSYQFLSLFFFFFLMNLTFLKSSSQVLHRMSLHLGFSDVFLMSILGLWILEEKTSEGQCSYHIISKGTCWHDLSQWHLLSLWFQGSLLESYCFSLSMVFGSESLSPGNIPGLGRALTFTFWIGEYLHVLFEIL